VSTCPSTGIPDRIQGAGEVMGSGPGSPSAAGGDDGGMTVGWWWDGGGMVVDWWWTAVGLPSDAVGMEADAVSGPP